MTATLSEAAAKLRNEVRRSLVQEVFTGTAAEVLAEAALFAFGFDSWEQAAKLKNGAKIVEVVDLPQPPINMEPSP